MKKIWIGKYQSDMDYTHNLFYGSISYYGNNNNNNICIYQIYGRSYNKQKFLDYILDYIKETLGQYEYIFYNQCYALEIINRFPEAASYIYNINDSNLINWISNKTFVRIWIQNAVLVPPFCVLTGAECNVQILQQKFPGFTSFIIQDNYSSGGSGTYLLTSTSQYNINSILTKEDIYLVSPYLFPSYSINVHILVGDKDCTVFPPSIQIIFPDNFKMIFRGSDFIEAQNIPSILTKEIFEKSKIIGLKLAHTGYRGICGVDFLIYSSKLYFIEINPRFQGSSLLINKALYDTNLPSLYELNAILFKNQSFGNLKEKLESLLVPYSYYKVKKGKPSQWDYVSMIESGKYIYKYYLDGYKKTDSYSSGYLIKFLLKKNIVSISPNNDITIYQNLLCEYPLVVPPKTIYDWSLLKVALLIQGLRINRKAYMYIKQEGGIKEGTFDAIDLYFSNEFIINCPLKIPFVEFSPFELVYHEDLSLLYCDKFVSKVSLDINECIPNVLTHSGIPYSKIVQRNNDRIRIRHNSVCIYKELGNGCKFCHSKNINKYYFDLDDIKEAIPYFLNNFKINQILIGGASNSREDEGEIIKNILKIIRDLTDKPVYIMSIPPAKLEDIQIYKGLGASEIAFNIEIFDQTIATKIMPGKGTILRSEYLIFLKEAVKCFGSNGQVRSMMIIGLESIDSFKTGIEELCKLGVSPMISPFRPIENTQMQSYVPLTLNQCKKYFEEALSICNRYQIELGPSSITTQNNTLNLVKPLINKS